MDYFFLLYYFQLLISVLVLRSLLATTRSPGSSTVKSSVTPNDTQTTATTVPSVRKPWLSEPPSTWVDIRLVNKKGIHLIMFANGTVAGTWNSSVTTIYGMYN